MKKCSIVILSYNQVNYTKDCLESIRTYTTCPYEIIMIDNGSDQETITYLEDQRDLRLIKNDCNLGFAGGCNQGIELSEGDYILLLNNDVIVTANWLENMISLMESDENIGLVGPLTNSTVGKQRIEVPYGEDLQKLHKFAESISNSGQKAWNTLRLTGFCLLICRNLIKEIGMLDTSFRIGNYEDDDFCIRTLLAGWKLCVCRTSFVHHFMNISFAKNNLPREEIMLKNKLLLEEKWSNMDWNHHAVANEWFLRKIEEQGGWNILHIGCGLGAIGVELKENNSNYQIIGVEEHAIRRKIAEKFLDQVYAWDHSIGFMERLSERTFDTIIIECTLEKTGLDFLERIIALLKQGGQILLRLFNSKHITTLERLITGEVGGNLLCATSAEFRYYFNKNVNNILEKQYGVEVLEEVEIRKTFTHTQEKLWRTLADYERYQQEAGVYNRLYRLNVREH